MNVSRGKCPPLFLRLHPFPRNTRFFSWCLGFPKPRQSIMSSFLRFRCVSLPANPLPALLTSRRSPTSPPLGHQDGASLPGKRFHPFLTLRGSVLSIKKSCFLPPLEGGHLPPRKAPPFAFRGYETPPETQVCFHVLSFPFHRICSLVFISKKNFSPVPSWAPKDFSPRIFPTLLAR